MLRHFLLLWKLDDQRIIDLGDQLLDHAAGGQLNRARINDILWPIFVRNGRLFLIGRIQIGEFVSQEEAVGRLGTNELWEGDYHILAKVGTYEVMRRIDITSVAFNLRFESSSGRDRLRSKDGGVDIFQFRQMRLLTTESANLISAIWYGHELNIDVSQDFLELIEDDLAFNEGKQVVRTREERHRNRKLVQTAKDRFKSEHQGKLYCEVCGFDFWDVYQIEYIEAHHQTPIASFLGEVSIHIGDLKMVCANCHRAIHHESPPLSIKKLKARLEARQNAKS
jgi:hypothetical protein